jgi:hypothetical protein
VSVATIADVAGAVGGARAALAHFGVVWGVALVVLPGSRQTPPPWE